MIRAIAKGAGQLVLSRLPEGSSLYRKITWELLGTHATHVDKLERVLPTYLRVWQQHNVELDRLWIHEPGPTPFWPLLSYLLTGRGAVLTGRHAEPMDRYLARAVNGVLATDLGSLPDTLSLGRVQTIAGLRWCPSASEAIQQLNARIADLHDLPDDTFDLCHSGGALEHLNKRALLHFLFECFRALRPGGMASHVFDHRDHLHHADNRLPFLAHLALPASLYDAVFLPPYPVHNRLTPTEVCTLFHRAGFERVAVRRLLLPSRTYVDSGNEAVSKGSPGLKRSLLAHNYDLISEADLRTAAAHYLFRKPLA